MKLFRYLTLLGALSIVGCATVSTATVVEKDDFIDRISGVEEKEYLSVTVSVTEKQNLTSSSINYAMTTEGWTSYSGSTVEATHNSHLYTVYLDEFNTISSEYSSYSEEFYILPYTMACVASRTSGGVYETISIEAKFNNYGYITSLVEIHSTSNGSNISKSSTTYKFSWSETATEGL